MKTVSEILEDGAATYEKKNADYGKSWQNIGHILYMLANEQPVVLESPEDWIAAGLFTRRMDKLARSFNGEFLAEEMNFEAATDADEDESVYAAMQAVNKYDRHAAEGYQKQGEPIYSAGSEEPVDHVETDGGWSGRDALYNGAWMEATDTEADE